MRRKQCAQYWETGGYRPGPKSERGGRYYMDACNIFKKTDHELEFQVEEFRIYLGSAKDVQRLFIE